MPGGRSAAPTAVTLVYYHVPTDQDEQQFPNAFPLPKSALEIRLRDIRDKLIREKFPLPGSYHFRFKLKWSDSQTVWMDVTNEDSVVPSYDDKIICKVLRTSWTKTVGELPQPPRGGANGQLNASAASSSGGHQTVAPSSRNSGSASGTTRSGTVEQKKATPPSKKGGVDLLGFDSTGNSPKNSKTTDLLFDGFTSAPPPKKDDFDLF